MLLGDVCTRGCRFCAVTTGNPRGVVDVREPEHVARAIAQMRLHYVVLTMVDRDDLLDGGAGHVARTVTRLKELRPDILVETLLGDFGGHMEYVQTAVEGGADVFAHNIEVVRRLQRTIRDVRCDYEQSLAVLRHAKRVRPEVLTKSSIMVGIGEADNEVMETLQDLRAADVDIVTLGQYLRPTEKHAPVRRYVEPALFDAYAKYARELGFMYCASAPLVRSSYKAAEVFIRGKLRAEDVEGALEARRAEALRAAEALRPAQGPGAAGDAASNLISASRLLRRDA
jgi:lipoic acid synthetase